MAFVRKQIEHLRVQSCASHEAALDTYREKRIATTAGSCVERAARGRHAWYLTMAGSGNLESGSIGLDTTSNTGDMG